MIERYEHLVKNTEMWGFPMISVMMKR